MVDATLHVKLWRMHGAHMPEPMHTMDNLTPVALPMIRTQAVVRTTVLPSCITSPI